jgi:hypothetical protein
MDLPRADARLVTTWSALRASGVTRSHIAAQLRAARWQRAGHAVVLHNGMTSERQRWVVARIHGGPDALLTAFTAATAFGLTGWERDVVHLLVPGGVTLRRGCPISVRLHHAKAWSSVVTHARARVHALPEALLRATTTFASARPGCGLLAAAVQQGLVTPPRLLDALDRSPRLRHRATFLATVKDIGQGADALSEIDFLRLCRRYRLPRPELQTIRRDSVGRRRYLDATWRRADGRLVVVEVDGALHLSSRRWYADQLRQNEISLTGALVLRFPSVIVRCEPDLVAAQLRRALGLSQRPTVDG